jgi:predicted outer membrane repeat protein
MPPRFFPGWTIGLLLALLLAALALPPARAAGVRYAAPTAQGSGDCSSWANACTLQSALSGAASGDQIWVQAGVHKPGTNRSDAFQLTSGVAVYGGFAGTESQLTQRDWQANLTILSGDIDTNDLNPDGNNIAETVADIQGSNSYHVVVASGVDSTAVLDGFIITAGQANGPSDEYADRGGGMGNVSSSPKLTNVTFSGNTARFGGGMWNFDNSNPALTNVTFRGNTADFGGGGMCNFDNSNPALTNVTFRSNTAGAGGGMYNYSSRPVLRNVTFSSNTATYGGGVINSDTSNPELTNVTFSGNTARFGGGMWSFDSDPVLTNVTFNGNMADYDGGGMYNDTSRPVLTNVTFSGNTALRGGGGMHNFNNSSPVLRNLIIWGNTAPTGPGIFNDESTPSVAFSDVQGCFTDSSWNGSCGSDGGNNIEADPLFVDADGADNTVGTADDNLRLHEASPAIDAGSNSLVPSGVTTDLDGNLRIVDGNNDGTAVVDMGAYELPDFTAPTATAITRASPNPTSAASVSFSVTFSEAVTGVDASDFSLVTSGSLSGASVTGVSGSGASYTVTVSTGSGSGTLRLDLNGSGTGIQDLVGNPIAGGFSAGEVYTITKTVAVFLPLVVR